MTDFSDIAAVMEKAVAGNVIPGAVLAFGQERRQLYCRAFGCATLLPVPQPMRTDTLFDLASLTKVVATTTLVMRLFEAGIIDLERPLGACLSSLYPKDKASLTPRLLLAHAAGLPAHIPFYRDFPPDPEDPHAQRRAVFQRVRNTPLAYEPGTESQYSDLGMILLGELLEALTGTTLDRLFEEQVAAPLDLQDAFFSYLDKPLPKAGRTAEAFAATEDCAWRRRLIRGQVHDENAFVLRGVAGHAGLFSAIDDLLKFTTTLLAALAGESDFLRADSLKLFTRRQGLVPGSDRALGWSTTSAGASCGQRFSPRAFGHTGFTGTSIWVDPERERFVILLSNRIHPHREDRGFLAFRPRLHDLILKSLERL